MYDVCTNQTINCHSLIAGISIAALTRHDAPEDSNQSGWLLAPPMHQPVHPFPFNSCGLICYCSSSCHCPSTSTPTTAHINQPTTAAFQSVPTPKDQGRFKITVKKGHPIQLEHHQGCTLEGHSLNSCSTL